MQYQIELPRSTTTLSQDANNIQPVLSQKSHPLERRSIPGSKQQD